MVATQLSAAALIAGLIIGSYATYQFMSGRVERLKNEQLVQQLDQREALDTAHRKQIEQVTAANNEAIGKLTRELDSIDDTNRTVISRIHAAVGTERECNLSRDAVSVLNDSIKAANGDARVPETPGVSASTTGETSTVTERELVTRFATTLRKYAVTARRCEALVRWVNTTYPAKEK